MFSFVIDDSHEIESVKDAAEEGAVPLEIANVVGVFYVLSSGVTVAMFLAFLVVVSETLKLSKEMKVRYNRHVI